MTKESSADMQTKNGSIHGLLKKSPQVTGLTFLYHNILHALP